MVSNHGNEFSSVWRWYGYRRTILNIYSYNSEKRLLTCDERLQKVFKEVLKLIDHTILEGVRGKEDQNRAFESGKSQLQWPKGKHNVVKEGQLSKAVDATPFPVDFKDTKRLYYFAGMVMGIAHMMGIRLRFGGDWNQDTQLKDETFVDAVHYELLD